MTKLNKIMSVLLTLVFTLLFVSGAAYVLRDKSGEAKLGDFYDDPSDYDVYIFGSSHAVMGLLPLELWQAEGISSYNFANFGQAIPVDYWVLRNAASVHKPELALIDVYTVFFDEKYSHFHMGYLHQSLDTMPWSATKLRALKDLLDDGENQMEMYMPFSYYHSRWDSLSVDDLKPVEHQLQFGADVNQQLMAQIDGSEVEPEKLERLTFPFDSYDLLPEDDKSMPPEISVEYIRKMIEFCQEEGIEVVLISSPLYLTQEQQRYLNWINDLATEYHVPFINGVRCDVVDYRTDMLDSGHLNSAGAHKWSSYVASYLMENYGLTDHRGDPDYELFDENLEAQGRVHDEQLIANSSLYGCLVLAADTRYDVAISIASGSAVYDDDEIRFLINNIVGLDISENEWENEGEINIASDADSVLPDVRELEDYDIIIRVTDAEGRLITECSFVSDYNGMDGFTRIFGQ